MSEDAILDILEKEDYVPRKVASESIESAEDTGLQRIHVRDTHTKHCCKCKRKFPTTMHICPFCHTYIANLSDF